jgi:hypothetical protein
MRPAAVLLGSLLLAAGLPAAAQGRPDLGAGPHLDRSETHGGEGSRHQGDVAPKPPAVPVVPDASAPASAGPSQAAPPPAQDDDAARKDDERKATRSKERMKKRPGYQEDAQPPRAHVQ